MREYVVTKSKRAGQEWDEIAFWDSGNQEDTGRDDMPAEAILQLIISRGVPRVKAEIVSESLDALASFPEVLSDLASCGGDLTKLAGFVAILEKHGFRRWDGMTYTDAKKKFS